MNRFEGGGNREAKIRYLDADFQILTRSQRLPHPTQRADAILEAALHLIGKAADGRTFRLIGIGASELRPATEADPPDLFGSLI